MALNWQQVFPDFHASDMCMCVQLTTYDPAGHSDRGESHARAGISWLQLDPFLSEQKLSVGPSDHLKSEGPGIGCIYIYKVSTVGGCCLILEIQEGFEATTKYFPFK